MYSPDSLKLATGGSNRNNVKIRDVKSRYKGLNLLKHPNAVSSLAWTSDGNKLITGSRGSIRIFDTTTWQQIAILEGHTDWVSAISLSRRNDLLASASWDQTARLWNIDTSLQVGLPLPHKNELSFVALSPDAKVLVTGCKNGNLYTWDIQEILKETGLGDPLPIGTNIVSVKYHPHTLSLTVSAVRHQKTVSNRMHPKVIYKYSTHPALRSVTGHFWKYVLYFNPSHSL
jgi:WD40 repeat protein